MVLGSLPRQEKGGLVAQPISAGVHQFSSREQKSCLSSLGRLGFVKLTFLVYTGFTLNILSKTAFDRLPATMIDKLDPSDTTATLANGDGLPIYECTIWSGNIWNSLFPMEFLVRKASDEGILGIALLAGQKCTPCLDKGISLALKSGPSQTEVEPKNPVILTTGSPSPTEGSH